MIATKTMIYGIQHWSQHLTVFWFMYSIAWNLQHSRLSSSRSIHLRFLPNLKVYYNSTKNFLNQHWFNTLILRRSGCKFKMQFSILFSLLVHVSSNLHLPWGSYWWWVNMISGNDLVPPGIKPLLDPMLPSSMSSYDVTRPQWVIVPQ